MYGYTRVWLSEWFYETAPETWSIQAQLIEGSIQPIC
jgi:hypothetical protein